MKHFLTLLFCCSAYLASAQTEVNGIVTDASTGEPLIGATIIYAENKGAAADLDGYFSINLAEGEHQIKVSYVGYTTQTKAIRAKGKAITLNFQLGTILLNEVQVVADIALDRKTPVAFSTISVQKVNEELASQDIPMVLNSTPGVYATQTGGGDGDARITIRGFNQRNVAVMIDGIPVNDMENGWVYWSNWFGLDAVTSKIQVQRGLGASKIAIPSVGGTMNILTKGTSSKKGGMLKQEVGSFGKSRTTLGYNSGKLDNGWGYTLAGSYKRGNGFVDETGSEGYFYYAKVQKELGKHTLSLTAMGAPQKHGQRKYKSDIATYDTTYAQSLGDSSWFGDRIADKGIGYNKHWGYLNRWTLDENGDTIHNSGTLNTQQNYYHKPQFSLKDFWAVNDELYISNIVYASIGNGGGTSIKSEDYDDEGQVDLQHIYENNKTNPWNIDVNYSDTERKATNYLRSSINNHYWYGALSTANYQASEVLTLSGGVDLRYYKGEHYREVYDLFGGDYIVDAENSTQSSNVKRVGDIISYHNDGLVKWSGLFSQAEYSKDKLSAFLNISGSNSAYKRVDYFKKMDLVLADTTYFEALGTQLSGSEMVLDSIVHNGQTYTMNSSEAQHAQTDWKWLRGYTFKGGANYNIDDNHNVFFNAGYISKAPRFSNVYDYGNKLWNDIRNEIVKAAEGGYSYRSHSFSANLNAYFTVWENKPVNGGVSLTDDDGNRIQGNINGIDALHKGVELDFAFPAHRKITVEGLLSLGDWQWTSEDTVRYYDDNANPFIDPSTGEQAYHAFDARGVHVGDAAQTQVGLSIRYEPIKNSYIKIRGTHFDRYYADFSPSSLGGENAGRESWQIPAYQLVDLHLGHKIKLSDKHQLNLRASLLNLLDEVYISDALNNDSYNSTYTDFDAKSAGVFFGLGRRVNLSAKFTF